MKTHTSRSFCFFSYCKAHLSLSASFLWVPFVSLVEEDAVCQLQWCLPYRGQHFSTVPSSSSALVRKTVGLRESCLALWSKALSLLDNWFLAYVLVLLSLAGLSLPIYTSQLRILTGKQFWVLSTFPSSLLSWPLQGRGMPGPIGGNLGRSKNQKGCLWIRESPQA